MEKWGYWERIGPGVANGQSEIKFTQLEFTRPADIANQFDPNEGFTGLIQVPLRALQVLMLATEMQHGKFLEKLLKWQYVHSQRMWPEQSMRELTHPG